MTNDKIEEIVEEFEDKVFDIYPFSGTSRYEYDVYIPKAKNWLRTTLITFADEIRKERVEHCSDINCPECPKVAYEAGVKAERERVVGFAKKLKGIGRSHDTMIDAIVDYINVHSKHNQKEV